MASWISPDRRSLNFCRTGPPGCSCKRSIVIQPLSASRVRRSTRRRGLPLTSDTVSTTSTLSSQNARTNRTRPRIVTAIGAPPSTRSRSTVKSPFASFWRVRTRNSSSRCEIVSTRSLGGGRNPNSLSPRISFQTPVKSGFIPYRCQPTLLALRIRCRPGQ